MADYGIHLILGIAIFGGLLGAWLFQKLHIPQVVGYIAIGLLIGESGLHIISAHDVQNLRAFNMFALGIIGFLVGGELRLSTFKKYGAQFAAILIGEGVLAFLLVGTASGYIAYLMSGSTVTGFAAGIVFGAIASATDPASTIDVLWEYRAKGVVTTSITAIVALDDALAMTLYGLGTSFVFILTGGHASISAAALHIAVSLIGAAIVGFIASTILRYLTNFITDENRAIALSIGLILILIGFAIQFDIDVILASMMLGFTLVNTVPRRSERLFSILRGFSIPIYVLFFVLVGARLSLRGMPLWLWGIVVAYVLFRSFGKMLGAYIGATVTHSADTVKKYLGLGLMAQGGVAIGLAIMASQHLNTVHIGGISLGSAIIYAVTATTFIMQIIGPPLVRLGVQLAKEIGKNITEEDIVAEMKVADVIDSSIEPLRETDSIETVVASLSRQEIESLPVVDKNGKMIGLVSISEMIELLPNQDTWKWMIAKDVMIQTDDITYPSVALNDALRLMSSVGIDRMIVLKSPEEYAPIGLIRLPLVRRKIKKELLTRQATVATES